MKMKKFGGTEKVVYDLVKPIADEQGYSIWDVSFEKEGAYWYLRVFIDHPLLRELRQMWDNVEPLRLEQVPADSLVREFAGDSAFHY